MALLEMGSEAINRASQYAAHHTIILLERRATAAGRIIKVEIWAQSTLTAGFKVGTFWQSNMPVARDWTCRDYVSLGQVVSGAKRTFTGLNIEVQVGDAIGIYSPLGAEEFDVAGGAGVYYKNGDWFDSAGPELYEPLLATHTVSLKGIGPAGGSMGGVI